MDFITHSLVGAGVARLATPRKAWLPQVTLAAIGGSLLMDSDSWLYFLGPNAYGFYHRVFTHSLPGLAASAVAACVIAYAAGKVASWRRFGWFLTTNLPKGEIPRLAPWPMLLMIAAIAAAMHWLGDVITGYGNLMLFWPWSKRDFSLSIVSSFDWFIFGATMSWHLAIREFDWPRRKQALLAAGWLAAVLIYLFVRHRLGFHSVW